jgi:hypothetical protein
MDVIEFPMSDKISQIYDLKSRENEMSDIILENSIKLFLELHPMFESPNETKIYTDHVQNIIQYLQFKAKVQEAIEMIKKPD